MKVDVGNWIPPADRLPEPMERCLFVTNEFGRGPMMFYGYRFNDSWFLDPAFYGFDGPPMHAPANTVYWLPVGWPEMEGGRDG